ncbi:hypothetical protein L207DRAFT_590485 [Hyaloscypha variabilis F]|jgi:hypothetical protein|uniref:Uncharacterized protein n=1 Tax=Hyaloscypha variabilis (strain UAMH 11265 / GT02V1 / F) TaxID=1149755 RepID=A0A2J6R2P0_HYAVF|nr:hypothetical protein L207DRAFT_590485 [Hyaloscypha variabilis F]
MARKYNSTTPRSSKKARAATHAEDQASSSSSPHPELSSQASFDREELLTEKADAKARAISRRAAQYCNPSAHSREVDDADFSYTYEDSENEEERSWEQGDDCSRDSEYESQVSDDPNEMSAEERAFVYRPDTPEPANFSENGDFEDDEDADVPENPSLTETLAQQAATETSRAQALADLQAFLQRLDTLFSQQD